jgi:hypothetical protein
MYGERVSGAALNRPAGGQSNRDGILHASWTKT